MANKNNDYSLKAISPIDGRYSSQIDQQIIDTNSEYGLIKNRLYVEIKWFIFLSALNPIKKRFAINKSEKEYLLNINKNFGINDAKEIKNIEKITNHDVKSIEYFLKNKFDKHKSLKNKKELIHFCATSEDINNISYALMYKDTKVILLNKINDLLKIIKINEIKYADTPMLSRTHGQKATPTTFGKELKVFTSRIVKQKELMKTRKVFAKMNGAVGNYNAHLFVLPEIKWDVTTKKFLKSLGLEQNEYTTQIENHDWLSESLNDITMIANILLDFSRDIWLYIMLDYLKQKNIKNEIGSSTMPHKVNPIDFENAEGNLEITSTLSQSISRKLLSSRLQRDLSDSTVLRNLGVIYSHFYLSIISLIKGMNKIDINLKKINSDLDNSWEVLAEPIQIVMRYHNIKNSYEIIKDATRGKIIDKDSIASIINGCDLDDNLKKKLLKLKPRDYIGLANKLTLKRN
ncbi:MAG: adenylosuccinate lyase [Gammaproteobacteria bacterium]|jgi:adenylosuccinate lyase|nr:adenylosuccinate lyase [Gammaproteobacteria bacterium]MBT7603378.1 adenylosuccinate lyase [Gammaproteobacteria bacterium]